MTQRLRLLCRQIYLPDVSRLAAFGVLPAYRGQGLAKKFLLDLLAALRDKELYSIRLEVRCDNTRGVSLYHALGFQVRRRPGKYPGDPQFCPEMPSWDMERTSADDFLRIAWSVPEDDLPWLASPLAVLTLPAVIIRDNKHAWCAVAELMGQPQIRCIFVEPAYRHQGRTRRILMKINARWPDICTSAAVPETLEPLFIAAGYQTNSLCQFEMALDL